jgi:ArsR family transcriptional regulator
MMGELQTTTDLLRLLGDPSRVRLLALLAQEELTVAELTGITQLTQSRVSTHLGKLRDAGLVRDRRVGASSYYALNDGGMPLEAERLWTALRESTRDPVLEQDQERARAVVLGRLKGLSWADAVAGRMERHYSPGRTWEATARGLLGLVRLGDVLDVASGDGALAELVAPRAASVTCLDVSEKVITAARRRLAHLERVRFVVGDMHQLPFDDESFDAVMLMNCLTYARDPETAVAQAARVLRPHGSVVGVTLREHAHERVLEAYNHVSLGFQPEPLRHMLEAAELTIERCEVTSREPRPPHFEIITFYATRPGRTAA